ncbi:VOC family protein [Bowmanella dokdonensis]|uniref:VOC family protein n=1 Tax=Bowmanella dokdonensis TaxID=751969 RepID=A0A939IS34_9ALTE|nr:VOC family protein [Bowmanella dokdonensis]MBN7826292.1 VOC family protein [Bowmanella dokdonensis]
MPTHHKINYLEIPAADLDGTKAFFQQAFDWQFTDYGPDYSCFTNGGLDGGFYRAKDSATVAGGSLLMVLYSKDLQQSQQQVEAAGGKIIKPVFSFPGGRRFHFADPSGNEYAIWSE